MELIWYTALIRAIPEAIGVVILTLATAKERTSKSNILKAGLLCGLVAFTMRMMPVKFGIHVIISAVIQAFIMSAIFDVKIHKIFKGLLICIFIMGVLEAFTFLFMKNILGLNLEFVYSQPISTLLAGLPSITLLYLIGLTGYKINNRSHVGEKEVENVY